MSTAKTCDATLSEAQGCLVLSTTILLTASKNRVTEVHRAVLTLLSDAFSKGIFSEFVPDLVLASYLGPDANTFSMAEAQIYDDSSEGSIAIAVLFSVVAVFAAAIWVCVVSPLTRQELINNTCAKARRKQYNPIDAGDAAEEVESNNIAFYRDED
jgi:hypothetical protein